MDTVTDETNQTCAINYEDALLVQTKRKPKNDCNTMHTKKPKITNIEVVDQSIVICNNSENVHSKSEKKKSKKTKVNTPELPLLFTPDTVIVTTMATHSEKKQKRKSNKRENNPIEKQKVKSRRSKKNDKIYKALAESLCYKKFTYCTDPIIVVKVIY